MPAQRVAASTSRSRNLASLLRRLLRKFAISSKPAAPDLAWTFAEPLVRIHLPPAASQHHVSPRFADYQLVVAASAIIIRRSEARLTHLKCPQREEVTEIYGCYVSAIYADFAHLRENLAASKLLLPSDVLEALDRVTASADAPTP
jgi:hypothetical protein